MTLTLEKGKSVVITASILQIVALAPIPATFNHHQNHEFVSDLTLGPGPCGLRAGLAAQGGGHNLRGKVEEVSQVLDTLIGKVPVEVTPGELLLDIPTGLQGLEGKAHTHYVVLPLRLEHYQL